MTINIDSVSSIIGTVISLTFSIYFFVSYLVVKKEKLYLIISFAMFTLFTYLLGYSFYSSSSDPALVLFWTRITYGGGAAISISTLLLSSDMIHKDSPVLRRVIFSIVLFMMLMIFLPNDLLFTKELNLTKTHSSVIKGPLFPYLLMIIYLMDLIIIGRFSWGLIQNKAQVYLIAPILFGLIFWFLEALFDGLFGAILSIVNFKLSLGPIIMTFSFALYSGRYAESKNRELIRVKEENKEIYNNLIYDKLSTLYSRQYFIEALDQRAALNSRGKVSDCVMFIDVDNFKSVNDELGHSAGDSLISYIGEILRRYSRKSDVCARYGGDEFVVLLEKCNSENACNIAEIMGLNFIEGLPQLLGKWTGCQDVSFSIGIIDSSFWSDDSVGILKKADQAMYQAKSRKGTSVVLYSGLVNKDENES